MCALCNLLSNVQPLYTICDWACENRACGLKHTMSFDETHLNAEIQYLDSVCSVEKPNKLSTNYEKSLRLYHIGIKIYESQKFKK